MDRHQILTLTAAMLLAVACTKAGEAIADIAASQLQAREVLFDDSVAGLGVDEIQSAVEALAAAHDGQSDAIKALESQVAELQTSLTATTASLEAALVRLDALETAAAASSTTIEGLVQSTTATVNTLNSLQSEVSANSGKTVAWTCPEDMVSAGDVCVEKNVRPVSSYSGARSLCHQDGRQLCDIDELYRGCAFGSLDGFETPNPTEWSDTWHSQSDVLLAEWTSLCSISIGNVETGDSFTQTHYRCCSPLEPTLVVAESPSDDG